MRGASPLHEDPSLHRVHDAPELGHRPFSPVALSSACCPFPVAATRNEAENNKNGFTPCAGVQDSKIQVLVGLAPCGGSEGVCSRPCSQPHMAVSNP